MRIGTMDGGQLGWRKNQNNRHKTQDNQNQRDMTSSDFSGSLPPDVVPSNTLSNGVDPRSAAAPDAASPDRARVSTPSAAPRAMGSVPGAGANNGRTVQWKGKALNLGEERAASVRTIGDDAAQNTEEVAVQAQNAQAQNVQVLNANLATLLTGMDEMCSGLQEIYGVLHKVSERDTAGERVFNTLHAELSDYKKDFIYEHLKPVVRPLLFLYDSLEEFEEEIERFDPPSAQPPSVEKSGVMPTRLVRQNTIYFREQLVEALRVCEVTPMDDPEGVFNARFHKAVKIVPVELDEDGKVQRVVRSGWFLNGHLLRPAEVVVGKCR